MSYGRIDIQNLELQVGEGRDRFVTLTGLNASINPGEFVCLLGPSGCGKSTLLGALAGHITPTQGAIRLDGHSITEPHPERGLVFQHHTLFPWLSIEDNVAFGLKMQGISKTERRRQARELLDLVGLSGFEQRYPRELSGGMQQRVEIARVLINHPRVLLMDEPFGALDALTRSKMQELLLEVWARIRTTVVFVTHDIDEALFLADRILIMGPRPGKIIEELQLDFERPRSQQLSTSPRFVELKSHCIALLRHDDPDNPLPRLTPLGGLSRTILSEEA